ncbi:endonuclease VII domain-containing protein [Sphingopyxis indica]|uniref:endonuclease VII domain-containing protein n=1 Tax=Sphingopyxis indica TaxID=436663 RepID=UPI00293939E9|nr:endonuclease VII domain-containing protein [Sphingopyxis indica]WOF44315.1 endonuclease VII domain-containing protein [Sphingopyxis indica]
MPTIEQMAQAKRRRQLRIALCSKCKRELPWEDFCPSPSRRPFGLASQCRECDRQRKAKQKRDGYWKNPEEARRKGRARRLKAFGCTPEDYDRMLVEQGGVCAICKRPERYIHHATRKPASLAVDHCHASGRLRDLLCANCNKGLGCFEDRPDLLTQAIEYLRKHSDE